jgi:environmental stress-induced protein Ves
MNMELGEFNVLKRDGCVKEYGESCQAKVEMSCSYQSRNVLFFRSEILRIFLCHNEGSCS